MREIRPSGLEAGGTGNRFSLCLSHSFVPQRDDGINPHGPKRGNSAREKCHCQYQGYYPKVGDRIARADADQQMHHRARQCPSSRQSNEYSYHDSSQGLNEDQPQDVTSSGAECRANPDFPCPLGCGVGNHAVHSHHGEDQTHSSQDGRHVCTQTQSKETPVILPVLLSSCARPEQAIRDRVCGLHAGPR